VPVEGSGKNGYFLALLPVWKLGLEESWEYWTVAASKTELEQMMREMLLMRSVFIIMWSSHPHSILLRNAEIGCPCVVCVIRLSLLIFVVS